MCPDRLLARGVRHPSRLRHDPLHQVPALGGELARAQPRAASAARPAPAPAPGGRARRCDGGTRRRRSSKATATAGSRAAWARPSQRAAPVGVEPQGVDDRGEAAPEPRRDHLLEDVEGVVGGVEVVRSAADDAAEGVGRDDLLAAVALGGPGRLARARTARPAPPAPGRAGSPRAGPRLGRVGLRGAPLHGQLGARHRLLGGLLHLRGRLGPLGGDVLGHLRRGRSARRLSLRRGRCRCVCHGRGRLRGGAGRAGSRRLAQALVELRTHQLRRLPHARERRCSAPGCSRSARP